MTVATVSSCLESLEPSYKELSEACDRQSDRHLAVDC